MKLYQLNMDNYWEKVEKIQNGLKPYAQAMFGSENADNEPGVNKLFGKQILDILSLQKIVQEIQQEHGATSQTMIKSYPFGMYLCEPDITFKPMTYQVYLTKKLEMAKQRCPICRGFIDDPEQAVLYFPYDWKLITSVPFKDFVNKEHDLIPVFFYAKPMNTQVMCQRCYTMVHFEEFLVAFKNNNLSIENYREFIEKTLKINMGVQFGDLLMSLLQLSALTSGLDVFVDFSDFKKEIRPDNFSVMRSLIEQIEDSIAHKVDTGFVADIYNNALFYLDDNKPKE